jgi:hypothetical protein
MVAAFDFALDCYCYSKMFELCHIFEGLVISLHIVILSCLLLTRLLRTLHSLVLIIRRVCIIAML